MSVEANKELVRAFMERAFNSGDLTVIDEELSPNGVDHQEPSGTDFIGHLKAVVRGMRVGFPDLHFEIHEIIGEGEMVAFRSTMTGTHLGELGIPNVPRVPPTGRQIRVSHMHFLRLVDGKTTDLWHIWDTPTMLHQLGLMPPMPQVKPA